MSSTKQLSAKAIAYFLEVNPTWVIKNEKLHKTFIFKDFAEAFNFMSQIAIVAERNDHHPEWLNIYKIVVVNLSTHDIGGISTKDIILANAMESITPQKAI